LKKGLGDPASGVTKSNYIIVGKRRL